VEMLEAGNREQAETAMRDHIQNVGRRLLEFLEGSQVAETLG